MDAIAIFRADQDREGTENGKTFCEGETEERVYVRIHKEKKKHGKKIRLLLWSRKKRYYFAEAQRRKNSKEEQKKGYG